MKRSSMKFSTPRAVAVVAMIAILAMGTLTVAFAADLGGIRRAATLWIQGKPWDAVVTLGQGDMDTEIIIEDDEATDGENARAFTVTDDAVGSYNVAWQDENGETHIFSDSVVAMDENGTVRPVTMDEIIAYLNGPSVDETDDGRIIASWYDQAEDITDRFEDGLCRVTLEHDGETVYMLVRQNGDGGYAIVCGNEGFEALEEEIAEAPYWEVEPGEE